MAFLKSFTIRPGICGYRIFLENRQVARASFNVVGSGGKLMIRKQTFRLAALGVPVINRYELRKRKVSIASMTLKILPLPASQVLEFNNQVFVWKNSRIFHENRELGPVKLRRLGSWFWSTIEIELPDSLPLIPQLFIVWHLLSGLGE
jgi:hypothetical protein